MSIYLAAAFASIAAALLTLFQISPGALKELQGKPKRPSLYQLTNEKKPGRMTKGLQNLHKALHATGQTGITYALFFASGLFVLGGILFGVSFGNPWLAPVLMLALASLPFLFIRIQYRNYRSLLLEELDVSLSIITSSYDRTDNILDAFRENLPYINNPLKGIFQKFLFAVEKAGIPVERAIDQMKDEVGQSCFDSWCDSLKRCVANRSLKASLTPFTEEITEIREIKAKAKTLLYDSKAEFIAVLILSGLFLLIKYLLLPAYMGMAIPKSIENIFLAADAALMMAMAAKAYFMLTDVKFEEAG